jgi:heat shock protein HtpX
VDRQRLFEARAGYRLRTWALMLAMLMTVPLVGAVIAGSVGAFVSIALVAAVLTLQPRLSARWLLRTGGARPLEPWEAPGVHEVLHQLVRRAGLTNMPRLLVRPGVLPDAFTTGEGDQAAIVLSTGLVRALGLRELAGVIAHELAHLKGADISLTRTASVLFSVTRSLALVGWLALLTTLPLAVLGVAPFPWWAALVVALAPTLAGAAFMALSRVRELEADAGAAALTGDPEGLASALARIDALHRPRFPFFAPSLARVELPSWLQSHPPTSERMERLLRLSRHGLSRPRRDVPAARRVASPPRRAVYLL